MADLGFRNGRKPQKFSGVESVKLVFQEAGGERQYLNQKILEPPNRGIDPVPLQLAPGAKRIGELHFQVEEGVKKPLLPSRATFDKRKDLPSFPRFQADILESALGSKASVLSQLKQGMLLIDILRAAEPVDSFRSKVCNLEFCAYISPPPSEETDFDHREEDLSFDSPERPSRSVDDRSDRGRRSSASTSEVIDEDESITRRRRRRRTRHLETESTGDDQITQVKGSTRLEAKKQRRLEGRKEGRRQKLVTESEYLSRRDSVNRKMLIRDTEGLNQIAVLEDDVLVEHYVARRTQVSMVGSVYQGKVQNVLPSMEAAFVDIGKGRNAVLYAGEVNWDAAGLKGRPRRIEQALKSGDVITVQVTKDPIGHKGARLTSQITLPGRYLVLVPSGSMTGISRRLPENERRRLKKILRKIVPNDFGVIIRTAAEGASEQQLQTDVERLIAQWEKINKQMSSSKSAPYLLHGEPELSLRVVRDIFNEDFETLVIQGKESFNAIYSYVQEYAPDLLDRLELWTQKDDIFASHRIDEQLTKGMDRKVWLPSGGYLIIDRTEAMTVIDVNTGKYTGSGGTLEETVTRNNLEAAEEIMRQLRLRDIGGIVVIDFVDMVLEANRDLVLRRLIECLSRDRTRHQVTEVTALGLVQMTRKRVGEGLVEAFSTVCECCEGRGFIVHQDPVESKETPSGGKRKKKEKRSEVKKLESDSKTRKSLAKVAAAAKAQEENLASSTEHETTTRRAHRPVVSNSVPDVAEFEDQTQFLHATVGPEADSATDPQRAKQKQKAQDSVKAALEEASNLLMKSVRKTTDQSANRSVVHSSEPTSTTRNQSADSVITMPAKNLPTRAISEPVAESEEKTGSSTRHRTAPKDHKTHIAQEAVITIPARRPASSATSKPGKSAGSDSVITISTPVNSAQISLKQLGEVAPAVAQEVTEAPASADTVHSRRSHRAAVSKPQTHPEHGETITR